MKKIFALSCLLVFVAGLPTSGYVTNPMADLTYLLRATPYVAVFRVERVEKRGDSEGSIVYRKLYDLQGRYPKELITQVFSLTQPTAGRSLGDGDFPVRPDAQDWQHAMAWAKAGKTAVLFGQYSGFGAWGYIYLDGGWYCVMGARDWEMWHSINCDEALLTRWHCGTPAQLAVAVEQLTVFEVGYVPHDGRRFQTETVQQLAAGAGKDAVLPVLAGGAREDLRGGRAKVAGVWVNKLSAGVDASRTVASTTVLEIGRQMKVAEALDRAAIPALIRGLRDPDRQTQRQAILTLGLVATPTDGAVAPLLGIVKESTGAVRLNALAAVAMIGVASNDAPLAAAVLVEAMKDRDSLVRRIAGHALGNLGEQARGAAALLAPMLPKAIGAGRLDFPETMLRVDPANTEASRFLMGLFTNSQVDRETRLGAGDVLRLARSASVPDLAPLLNDPDADLRLMAVELLGRQGPAARAAIGALTELVAKDANPTLRGRAATALANLGPDAKIALPVLKAAMSDPSLSARKDVVAEIWAAGACIGGLGYESFGDANLERAAESGYAPEIGTLGKGGGDWSLRFIGMLTPPADGEYAFRAEADTGVRVKIGSNLVIDGWAKDGARTGKVTLLKGEPVRIAVEYFFDRGNGGAQAVLRVFWTPPGGQEALVPVPPAEPVSNTQEKKSP